MHWTLKRHVQLLALSRGWMGGSAKGYTPSLTLAQLHDFDQQQ